MAGAVEPDLQIPLVAAIADLAGSGGGQHNRGFESEQVGVGDRREGIAGRRGFIDHRDNGVGSRRCGAVGEHKLRRAVINAGLLEIEDGAQLSAGDAAGADGLRGDRVNDLDVVVKVFPHRTCPCRGWISG
ncbi:MAG: hypothetical protein EOR39_02710 [Mesorhizobium sp.]|nr:MAG: hypothetical protein EOR39_02710 [Mesorhizobium sp.]